MSYSFLAKIVRQKNMSKKEIALTWNKRGDIKVVISLKEP